MQLKHKMSMILIANVANLARSVTLKFGSSVFVYFISLLSHKQCRWSYFELGPPVLYIINN